MRRWDRRISLIKRLRRWDRRRYLLNYSLASAGARLNSPCRNCSFTFDNFVHSCEAPDCVYFDDTVWPWIRLADIFSGLSLYQGSLCSRKRKPCQVSLRIKAYTAAKSVSQTDKCSTQQQPQSSLPAHSNSCGLPSPHTTAAVFPPRTQQQREASASRCHLPSHIHLTV